jgi:endopolyphosphatase
MKKRKGGHRHHLPKDDCSRPENEDKPHCTFKHLPRHYDKNSPSRRNGPLTPLGYTQFYLPEVDAKGEKVPEWKVEYMTFKSKVLAFLYGNGSESGSYWNQPSPIPAHLLPGWKALEIEDEQGRDGRMTRFREEMKKITPWGMKDLTIGSWVRLARMLVERKKMWNKFEEIM